MLCLSGCGTEGARAAAKASDAGRVPSRPHAISEVQRIVRESSPTLQVADGGAPASAVGDAGSATDEDGATPPDRQAIDGDAAAPVTSEPRPYPFCPSHATTLISATAFLFASTPTGAPWDPFDKTPAASWWETTVFDSRGRPATLGIYFIQRSALAYEYHVLLDDAALELGSGKLVFDETYALKHVEQGAPTRLPEVDSANPIIALDFGHATDDGGAGTDGVQMSSTTATESRLFQNGNEAVVGYDCPTEVRLAAPTNDAVTPAASMTTIPRCQGNGTGRIIVDGNLSSLEPVAGASWDPLSPRIGSPIATSVKVADSTGKLAELGLFFVKTASQRWEYHMLLGGVETGVELGSGTLDYNPNGSLRKHTVVRELSFPEPDGSQGDSIVLDFGAPTDDGGNGVDGVTAFAAGTYLPVAQRCGADPVIGSACATDCTRNWPLGWAEQSQFPDVFEQSFQCAGRVTKHINVSLDLDPVATIESEAWDPARPVETSLYDASATIYGADLDPWKFDLYVLRFDDTTWEAHAQLQRNGRKTTLGVTRFTFDESGWLAHLERMPPFRLTRADGTPGPSIDLDFGIARDEPGNHQSNVVAWGSGSSSGTLMQDGLPPVVGACTATAL